jgi:hypothetical protein
VKNASVLAMKSTAVALLVLTMVSATSLVACGKHACVNDKGTKIESCSDISAKVCKDMGGEVHSGSCADLGYNGDKPKSTE